MCDVNSNDLKSIYSVDYLIQSHTDKTTYKIPLDDIDFNLLSSTLLRRPGEGGSSFWDKNPSIGKIKYFVVDIIARKAMPDCNEVETESVNNDKTESANNDKTESANNDKTESANNDKTESANSSDNLHKSYLCHICNVEVPEVYKNEHESGLKHKTRLTIANTALDRIRKYINHVFPSTTEKCKDGDYFCDSCVLIMKQTDKVEHDKSRTHRISIKYDKLLNDLYIGNENIDHELLGIYAAANSEVTGIHKNNISQSLNSSIDSEECEDEMEFVDCITTDNEDMEPHENDNSLMVDALSDNENIDVITDGNEVIPTSTVQQSLDIEKRNLRSYIHFVTLNYNTSYTITVVDDKIQIKTANGDIAKVDVLHFHGFYNIDRTTGRAECNVCYQYHCTFDMETHIYSVLHMRKLMTDIKDRNFIRELDDYFSHCIICNRLIHNSLINDHIQNFHLSQSKIRYNGVTKKQQKSIQNESRLDSETVESNLETYVKILRRKYGDYIKTVGDDHIEITALNSDKIIVSSANFDGYDTTDPNVNHCLLCSTLVEDKQEHKLTVQHMDNVMVRVPNEHCIRKLPKLIMYNCVLCNRVFRKVDKHKSSQKHRSQLEHTVSPDQLQQTKEKPPNMPNKSSELQEGSSGTHRNPQELHGKALLHENLPEMFARISNLYEKWPASQAAAQQLAGIYCRVCSLNVLPTDVKEHESSSDHNLNILKTIVLTDSEEFHKFLKTTEFPNRITCCVCNTVVPNNKSNIEEHVKGSRHAANTVSLLKTVTIKHGKYFCTTCSVFILKADLIYHIIRNDHRAHIVAAETTT